MKKHIIQMTPFRDFIICLDDEGRVWKLIVDEYRVEWVLLT